MCIILLLISIIFRLHHTIYDLLTALILKKFCQWCLNWCLFFIMVLKNGVKALQSFPTRFCIINKTWPYIFSLIVKSLEGVSQTGFRCIFYFLFLFFGPWRLQVRIKKKCGVRRRRREKTKKTILGDKVRRKRHTLPLAQFDVSFLWDPPAPLKWRRWMVRDNPRLRHRHTTGLSCLWIWMRASLGFCSSHGPSERTKRKKKKDKLNGTTMVHASAGESVAAGRVGDRVGLWSMWHSLATLWCWVLLFWSYRRRAAATLREDVEPIHERQHQESWAGIQLHRQTAGRYGIYVHHSG